MRVLRFLVPPFALYHPDRPPILKRSSACGRALKERDMSPQTRITQRQLLAYAALKAGRYTQANLYLIAWLLSAPTSQGVE